MIPWNRPRGAVHDLGYALELGDGGCNVLVVSDVTLYVLQNFVALDVEFMSRWATSSLIGGYVALDKTHESYEDWVNLVQKIQREVQDMSCDLVAAIESLSLQIENLVSQQAGGTNACCDWVSDLPGGYYGEDPGYYPPPDAYVKCQGASSLVLNWQDAALELYSKRYDLGQLSIAVLLAILGALAVPGAGVLIIAGALVAAILEVDQQEFETTIGSIVDDLICAIYDAASPSSAIDALAGVIGGLDNLNGRTRDMLLAMFSNAALNQVFDETYPIRGDAQSDCGGCTGQCIEVEVVVGSNVEITESTVSVTGEELTEGGLKTIWVYFDVYETEEGLAYCEFEDGKTVTDIEVTNNLVGLTVFDRENNILDQAHFYPPNGNLPSFPYEEVGHLEFSWNTGQSGSALIYIEEP